MSGPTVTRLLAAIAAIALSVGSLAFAAAMFDRALGGTGDSPDSVYLSVALAAVAACILLGVLGLLLISRALAGPARHPPGAVSRR